MVSDICTDAYTLEEVAIDALRAVDDEAPRRLLRYVVTGDVRAIALELYGERAVGIGGRAEIEQSQ